MLDWKKKIAEGLTAHRQAWLKFHVVVRKPHLCVCAVSFASTVRLKVEHLCNLKVECSSSQKFKSSCLVCVYESVVANLLHKLKFFLNELVPLCSLMCSLGSNQPKVGCFGVLFCPHATSGRAQ